MKEYLTAHEAAEKLGYEYTYFTRLLKAGRIPGAVYWHGYAVPATLKKDDIEPAVKQSPRRSHE